MILNKKGLAALPLAALLFTSCGPNWKEIDATKAAEIRDAIEKNLEFPNSMKVTYAGDKFSLLGQEYKKFGTKLSYDKSKLFLQKLQTYDVDPTTRETIRHSSYYVVKNNKLWDLYWDVSGKKAKQEVELEDGQTIEEAFADATDITIKLELMGSFSDSASYVESIISTLEMLKLGLTGGTIEYKFYSHSDNSLKFSYNIRNAVFTPPNAIEDMVFNGSEEYVIENGRLAYEKTSGNTIFDIAAASYGGEKTESNANKRLEYNCKIDIPAEADPDTWCE